MRELGELFALRRECEHAVQRHVARHLARALERDAARSRREGARARAVVLEQRALRRSGEEHAFALALQRIVRVVDEMAHQDHGPAVTERDG